jgi:hypothetical protein
MKYYLTCPNCGFSNDASSEFLIFCDRCKKKLPNNFRDWLKNNPEQHLDAFHLEECITEIPEDSSKHEPENSSTRVRHIWAKVFLVSLLLLFSILLIFPSTYRDSQLILYFKTLINSFSMNMDWKREVYGDYGLSIESPVRLKSMDIPVPLELEMLLNDIQSYSSELDGPLSVMVISTDFNPQIGRVNLQASITGFLNQIRAMPGISNFKVSQRETSVSGYEGYEQVGSFLQNGRPKSFISIGVARGLILWQAMVVCDADNAEYEEAAQRTIESIEILYNSKV